MYKSIEILKINMMHFVCKELIFTSLVNIPKVG